MDTTSKQEAIDIFNDYLEEMGHEPIPSNELVDYDFRAGQTIQEIKEWAREFVSEFQTIKSENKNSLLFQY